MEEKSGAEDLEAVQAHLDLTMSMAFDVVRSAMLKGPLRPSESSQTILYTERNPRYATLHII